MSAVHALLHIHVNVPVYSGGDLVQLIIGSVGQGVDICGKTGGGGCIDASDMVVNAYLYKALACVLSFCSYVLSILPPSRLFNYLFVGRLDWLLNEMD
jgi:hypothetical protein